MVIEMDKAKGKSNINCCVYGCHTKKGRDNSLSFHRFPKEKSGSVYVTNKCGIQEKVDKKKAWELKLLMEKPTTQYMRVCSLHFNKSDYILPDAATKLPRLNQNAVPSQNLPGRKFVIPHQHRKLVELKESQEQSTSNSDHEMDHKSVLYQEKQGTISYKERIAIEALLKLNSDV